MKTKKIVYIGSQPHGMLGIPGILPPYGIRYVRGEPVELAAELADEYLAMRTAGKPDWKPYKSKKG